MNSEATQDYLKTIYEIEHEAGQVSTTALAERLGINPASVTGMAKKLAKQKLVHYEPYQGLRLTAKGKRIALRVLRAHRLAELYLAEALNVPWDKVHDEAEKWEHVISEQVEARMDEALGYPSHDPHGAPIPGPDGSISYPNTVPLSSLPIGQTGVVAEVCDADPELLRYFSQLQLKPNITITLIDSAPFNGPLTIKIGHKKHILGRKTASKVLLTQNQF